MKRPNLFIIGAPKCGTTSLARYLEEHPEIFISDPKEPCFFNTDMRFRNVNNIHDYNSLFERANEKHTAVGEGSTLYLYSAIAVKNILTYNPSSKFIIMLRNPVDMAYSWHNQLLFSGQEYIRDFVQAWRAQEDRMLGRRIGAKCTHPELLQYGSICKVGMQVKRVFTNVQTDKVLIVLFDHLSNDSVRIYDEVLSFLDVSPHSKSTFTSYNTSKVHRFNWLATFFKMAESIKQLYEVKCSTGLLAPLHTFNTLHYPRPPLSNEFREELVEFFREDINALSGLIGQDLSHWR